MTFYATKDIDVDGVYQNVVEHCLFQGSMVSYGNNVGTGSVIEIRPTLLEVRGDKKYITTRKKFNLGFALAEVLWILRGSSDVKEIAHYNKQMNAYSDDQVEFNAAYGNRIFRNYGDQFFEAYKKLNENISTRHGVISLWDPKKDNISGSKDYPCNNISYVKVRQNHLQWTQVMRSNDLIWGLPYNFVQFISLMQIMASLLDVGIGTYTHISDSSHIYPDHRTEAEEIIKVQPLLYESPALKFYSDETRTVQRYEEFQKYIGILSEIEYQLRSGQFKGYEKIDVDDTGFNNLMAVIAFTNFMKTKNYDAAEKYLHDLTPNSFEVYWCASKFAKVLQKVN